MPSKSRSVLGPARGSSSLAIAARCSASHSAFVSYEVTWYVGPASGISSAARVDACVLRNPPSRVPSRSPPTPRPIRAPVRSTSSGLAREAHEAGCRCSANAVTKLDPSSNSLSLEDSGSISALDMPKGRPSRLRAWVEGDSRRERPVTAGAIVLSVRRHVCLASSPVTAARLVAGWPYASSLPALRLPVRPLPDSRRSIPGLPFSSSALTCHAPKAADRLGLALNVGEKGRVVISLQPLLDEGPEDDLKAHRELERDRCLPGNDPSLVQDVLRENEQDLRSILEHHHLLPAQRTPDPTPGACLPV